jgi:hypothetical protein
LGILVYLGHDTKDTVWCRTVCVEWGRPSAAIDRVDRRWRVETGRQHLVCADCRGRLYVVQSRRRDVAWLATSNVATVLPVSMAS